MFSNKLFPLKFGLALAIILGASLYSLLALRYKGVPEIDTVVCKYRRVSEIGENYFAYSWGSRKTTVFGDVSGIRTGDYVSFSATPLGSKELKLESFHVHKYRRCAIYLSILPLIVVFWILTMRLRWSRSGFTLVD